MERTLTCLTSADPKDIKLYSSMRVPEPELFAAKKVSSLQVPAFSPMRTYAQWSSIATCTFKEAGRGVPYHPMHLIESML